MFGLNVFRKKKNNLKNIKDSDDLTTTIIVISGLAVAAVLIIGGVAYASKDSGRASAECIANHSTFKSDSGKDCQQKAEESNTGNNGTGDSNVVPGEKPEEKPDTPASDDTCFELDGIGSTITGYKIELEECTTDVVIPSSINGNIITGIGEMAFADNQLTSVIIPNGVTSVGWYAFALNQLTSVNIPDSVTRISEGAFTGNQLTSVSISDSVTRIEEGSFSENMLTSVIIPDGVTIIGNEGFS